MAIVAGDILQILLVQSYLSQEVNNVFHYQADTVTGSPTYDEVNDAFAVQVLDLINDIQNTFVNNVRVIIKNLTNGLDIYEVANIATGVRTGDATPSFTAFSYRLIRSTALTRHGSKRFAGISETDVSGNELTGTINTPVLALETALGSPISVDGVAGDVELIPVIVGRFPIGNPNAGELDLSKINPVQAAQYIRVSTQTTRRAGRGV